jgi:hypothetical protein
MTARVAIGLVVLVTAAPAPAQSLVCSPVYADETGPAVAFRLTGDPDNLYQPWFRFADATGRLVPQSQHTQMRADWQVCLARDITRATDTLPVIVSDGRRSDIEVAVRIGLAVFLILLPWALLAEHLRQTRPVPIPMRHHAHRFIDAFARPLLLQSSTDAPIRSRPRYQPARREVEILIAPGAGRRYPNLSDHRGNVEYDVRRVLCLLENCLVVSRPLRVEGQWVVISVRSNADVKEAGVT